jgi:hypothetical protein
MIKAFLLSVLVASVAVPTLAARSAAVRRGVGWVLLAMATFVAVYWLGVQYLVDS